MTAEKEKALKSVPDKLFCSACKHRGIPMEEREENVSVYGLSGFKIISYCVNCGEVIMSWSAPYKGFPAKDIPVPGEQNE